jgi:hypothetical protein
VFADTFDVFAQLDQITLVDIHGKRPNENKMSCRERWRARLRIDGWNSYEAVSTAARGRLHRDWLDLM